MVKVGLIARAENRGLGRITSEFQRHLQPDRTLVIDMGELNGGFDHHFDRYPGATHVRFDGVQLDRQTVGSWLYGLDVVYSAETFYDWSIVDLAHDLGVATVLHVMPEFLRHHGQHGLPTPTVFWNPTHYLADRMPPGTVEVPIPVDLPQLAGRGRENAIPGPIRLLHVAGHGAMADRNGTSALMNAIRTVDADLHLTVTTQDPKPIRVPKVRPGVTIEIARADVADYADLYDGHDVLVMPRRYAGLCLPVQEALGAGLGVVMTDVEPNRRWPIAPIESSPAGYIRCQAGLIPASNASPRHLSRTLTNLARNPETIDDLKADARVWAEANSWDRLGPVWSAALADAVTTFRG